MHASFKRLYSFLDICGAWLMPICLLYGIWLSFNWSHQELLALGWSASIWVSGLIWLGVGVLCALYWPWRYREGMKGLWRAEILHIALLSLTGPWALLFGFPL